MPDAIIETRIFKVEPLADPEFRGECSETLQRALRRPVFANQPHIEVAVIGGSFGFAMARRGRPGARQIVKAVPMDTRHAADQQFRRSAEAELLHLLRAEA